MKYFDIHMTVEDDSKEGYSVFVKANDANEAVEVMTNGHLYEEPEDLDHIDYVGEISEKEYNEAMGIDNTAYGDQSRWFLVDAQNIENIKKRGYYGKDGIQEGYYAAAISDGFEVISDKDYNEVYGIEDMGEERE